MVVVKSTEDEGVCYVETKNLDGETNLKNKVVPKMLWNTFDHTETAISHFDATLDIEGPNNLIYKFDGKIECKNLANSQNRLLMPNEEPVMVPLSNDNVVLRGMSLRNTEEIIGIVVYTGHETKIQMNTSDAVYKVSKMMALTNLAIFYIFILQVLFSLAGAFICATWTLENQDNPYLAFDMGGDNVANQDLTYIVFTMAGSWILIFW